MIYKYDREEEDLIMPVRVTKPMGRGTAIPVSLDIFPTPTMAPALTGNIMFFEKRKDSTAIQLGSFTHWL